MSTLPLKLERRALGPAARDYLRAMFMLDTVFCRTLSEAADLAAGDVFAFLPAGLSDARAHDFTAGFMPLGNRQGGMSPLRTIVDVQAAEALRFLRGSANACAMADDANLRWSAPQGKSLANGFHVGEEVYALLTAQDTESTVRAVLSATNWIWHGLVALCVPPRLQSRTGLSDAAALTACLRNVRAVQAVAYDGEGYVEWRRPV